MSAKKAANFLREQLANTPALLVDLRQKGAEKGFNHEILRKAFRTIIKGMSYTFNGKGYTLKPGQRVEWMLWCLPGQPPPTYELAEIIVAKYLQTKMAKGAARANRSDAQSSSNGRVLVAMEVSSQEQAQQVIQEYVTARSPVNGQPHPAPAPARPSNGNEHASGSAGRKRSKRNKRINEICSDVYARFQADEIDMKKAVFEVERICTSEKIMNPLGRTAELKDKKNLLRRNAKTHRKTPKNQ